jgi:hypothetical protein
MSQLLQLGFQFWIQFVVMVQFEIHFVIVQFEPLFLPEWAYMSYNGGNLDNKLDDIGMIYGLETDLDLFNKDLI